MATVRAFKAWLACALLACAIVAGSSQRSSATAASPLALPVEQSLTYHCQWTQRLKSGIGWTGTMSIRVNAQGLINGTYKSTSIKPDPFYGKIVTVTGGLSGKNIRLSFGIVPSVTVNGEVVSNGIQGTTSLNGGRYEFLAALAQ